MTLRELNAIDADAVAREFQRCCGSTRWTARMAAARPFRDLDDLLARSDATWRALAADDWLEAFAAHPRIGQQGGPAWSAQEQAGAAGAAPDVRHRLAAANRDYEARFGYIFIVCATGKSADEMLAALEARLRNEPARELRIAADEQRKITRLRLAKLVDANGDRPS
jgi:2-oxo-4-hydroxy-4-carboxy-5-ureidoimidazoline decarboxylase